MNATQSKAQEILQGITELPTGALATRAECHYPDTTDGQSFLSHVRDGAVERLAWIVEGGQADTLAEAVALMREDGGAREVSDDAVPIYTAERWRTFVDVGAFGEDVDEIAGGSEDMTTLAGFALYVIAERLVENILQDVADQDADA